MLVGEASGIHDAPERIESSLLFVPPRVTCGVRAETLVRGERAAHRQVQAVVRRWLSPIYPDFHDVSYQ